MLNLSTINLSYYTSVSKEETLFSKKCRYHSIKKEMQNFSLWILIHFKISVENFTTKYIYMYKLVPKIKPYYVIIKCY